MRLMFGKTKYDFIRFILCATCIGYVGVANAQSDGRAGAPTTIRNASRAVPVADAKNTRERSATNRTTNDGRTTSTQGMRTRKATTQSRVARVDVDNSAKQNITSRRTTPTVVSRAPTSGMEKNDMVTNIVRGGTRGAVRARATAPVSAQAVIDEMDQVSQITTTCKAQYIDCMDNFCNVLDENQGRCSCSKNVKNYAKTEEALKAATETLQDVAQKIQYIGLSGEDIDTLFAQTEAELALQGSSDSSQIKTDLDKIKNMIVDIKSGTASSSEVTTGIGIDLSGLLDFNIDSTGFDLSALFGTPTTNTASISNQRGEELYKTAASRCKAAVLTDCQKQGVDIAVISNSYDLEIDKQCVAYERTLTDANDQMKSTVRNAQSVLQKARLMVAQQKNSYDLRGCINALDSCMQDDFVCGTDYENCLDPFGKYIVEGEVVIGSEPGQALAEKDNDDGATPGSVGASELCPTTQLYSTWEYNDGNKTNAWCGGSVSAYIEKEVANFKGDDPDNPTATGMIKFLMNKIGYNEDSKDFGMCMSVLNKCQNYTYDEDKNYITDNTVIKEYLRRTLPQIKVMQDEIINSHAESCIGDVQSCLNQNNYSTSPTVAINACRSIIVTCMSVNGDETKLTTATGIKSWVEQLQSGEKSANCISTGGTWGFDAKSEGPKCNCVAPRSELNAITGQCECKGGKVYDSASKTCKCPSETEEIDGVCKPITDEEANSNPSA